MTVKGSTLSKIAEQDTEAEGVMCRRWDLGSGGSDFSQQRNAESFHMQQARIQYSPYVGR